MYDLIKGARPIIIESIRFKLRSKPVPLYKLFNDIYVTPDIENLWEVIREYEEKVTTKVITKLLHIVRELLNAEPGKIYTGKNALEHIESKIILNFNKLPPTQAVTTYNEVTVHYAMGHDQITKDKQLDVLTFLKTKAANVLFIYWEKYVSPQNNVISGNDYDTWLYLEILKRFHSVDDQILSTLSVLPFNDIREKILSLTTTNNTIVFDQQSKYERALNNALRSVKLWLTSEYSLQVLALQELHTLVPNLDRNQITYVRRNLHISKDRSEAASLLFELIVLKKGVYWYMNVLRPIEHLITSDVLEVLLLIVTAGTVSGEIFDEDTVEECVSSAMCALQTRICFQCE